MAARVTEKRTKKTRTHSNDENRRMENRFICSVHALPFTRSSTSSIFNIHRRETGTYRQDYMVNSRSAEILLCHTCTLIPKIPASKQRPQYDDDADDDDSSQSENEWQCPTSTYIHIGTYQK